MTAAFESQLSSQHTVEGKPQAHRPTGHNTARSNGQPLYTVANPRDSSARGCKVPNVCELSCPTLSSTPSLLACVVWSHQLVIVPHDLVEQVADGCVVGKHQTTHTVR